MPTFERQSFLGLTPDEQDQIIFEAVERAGLYSPSLVEAANTFNIMPDQISRAIGIPVSGLPTGLQSIDSLDFEARTIPGITPSTFIPQVSDINTLSGVQSGLPSLTAQPLPSYTPIDFTATPEQVAAATIGAVNAAEAEQS